MKTRLITALVTATLVFASAACTTSQAGSFSAGIRINDEAVAEETGMRVYPGATPIEKKKREGDPSGAKGDSDSANIQFSFGEYGLKVIVAKLRSGDSPDKVAAFYRNELARFGDVLDCSDPRAADVDGPKDRKSKVLRCDRDKPRKNGMLYKAGRKDDQHVVEIRPSAEGTEFSLVHVAVRSPD